MEGKDFYPLAGIATLLGLTVESEGGFAIVKGKRDKLRLQAGRPLVSVGEQYILLSERALLVDRNWYVPEDFLTKVAGLLIEDRVERTADHAYSVAGMAENEVVVEVINYPDHVSIVFLPSRRVGTRIRELRNRLRVEFSEFRVRPRFGVDKPAPRMVSEIRFAAAETFGVFEIMKGSEFEDYRDYSLQNPFRRVIDVYASPSGVVSIPGGNLPGTGRNESRTPAVAPPGTGSGPAGDRPFVTNSRKPVLRGPVAVTVDPGHGGMDSGLTPTPEFLEKSVNLEIASSVMSLLRDSALPAETTRRGDMGPSDDQRSSAANINKSRVFVSLHLGSSASADVHGPVVFVQKYLGGAVGSGTLTPFHDGQRPHLASSKRFAAILQSELNDLFGTDNQVAEAPLAVLSPVSAPAVLVETGFVTNSSDLAKLSSQEFRKQVAGRIVRAVVRFLQ
jgi:N-acetylmuramoyl-L-alanine amidase